MTIDRVTKYDIGSDKLVALLVHLLPVICLLALLLAPATKAQAQHEYECSTDTECYEECLEVEANPEICDEVF